ncbi:MAG: DMT family transporter [Alphaproteobacteria bacterium]|nr:DMT family transporter [Alphaproteobacteria bacterium]
MTAADTIRYAAIMLLAGVGIPVLAALNAQLGRGIGSPPAAAVVLFAVALLAALTTMLLTTGAAPLGALAGQPNQFLFAGLLIAFYVLSITWVAPRFGVGNAIFCVLLGQMVSATLIDQFGLMGAIARDISLLRALGIGLMAAGLALVLRA